VVEGCLGDIPRKGSQEQREQKAQSEPKSSRLLDESLKIEWNICLGSADGIEPLELIFDGWLFGRRFNAALSSAAPQVAF
jgi:hypothetical protein